MNREQLGGGDHPRRPPLRLPVLIVARSLGIGLGCICLPILGIQWLADHVCFSKAESEKHHKQSLATIEIKRDKEVNSLLICLEKQIKGGIEAQGTIRCLQEEIASLKVQMQGLEHASLEFSIQKNIMKAYYKEEIEQLEENLRFEKNVNDKETMELAASYERKLDEAKKELNSLNSLQKYYKREVASHVDNTKREKQLNVEMTKELQDVKNKLKTAIHDQQKEYKTLSALKNENMILKSGQAFSKKEYEKLEDMFNQEKERNVTLEKEFDLLRIDYYESIDNRKMLNELYTSLETKTSSLKVETSKLIDELKNKLTESQHAENEASQHVCEIKMENETLKVQLKKEVEKHKNRSLHIRELETENKSLKDSETLLKLSCLQFQKENVETRKELEEMREAEKKASQLALQLQTQNLALKGVMEEEEKFAANLQSQNEKLKEENQKLTSLLQAAKSNGPTIASNGEKVNGSAYAANGQDEMRNNDIIKQNEKHVKEKLLVPNKEISQKARAGENRRIIPTGWGMQLVAPKISFADVAEEEGDDDDLLEEEEEGIIANPTKTRPDSPITLTRPNSPQHAQNKESEHVWVLQKKNDNTLKEGPSNIVTEEEGKRRERRTIWRRRNFVLEDNIEGHVINILSGLELHEDVFNTSEQNKIINHVYKLQEKGRSGQLRDMTYVEPKNWKTGKGRMTMQFGCIYNYSKDKAGNIPGLLRDVEADPIPPPLKWMIRKLMKYQIFPEMCEPDSCIINIYEPGNCMPPHIDSHDFLRPICTVSLVSECDIMFGARLKAVGAGQFDGSFRLPLPVGSVLILAGNAADVAMHCVPSVPTKRISITFRKMARP